MRRAGPRSALALLEREEDRALEELKRALASAGEDLLALGEVRALARRHPELTIVASAALGVALAPLLARVARTAMPMLLETLRSGGACSLSGLSLRWFRSV